MNKEEFIKKSNNIHNNKYDYSLVNYKNNKTKVKIICSSHGMFLQIPNSHLNGSGCRKCSIETRSINLRKNTNKFIHECNKIHNNKYIYENIQYINNIKKINIICPIHGVFEQIPKSHLKGHGCDKCGRIESQISLRKSQHEFINQCNIIHNNRYDYSLVEYINNRININIICKEHGEFKQQPSHHLNGSGCPKCSGNYNKTNEEFINECNIKHNEKYDYSLVMFKSNNFKVNIICKEHGEFKQQPSHHLNGHGCPECSSSKGEEEISSFLKYEKIEFIQEKTFIGCDSKKGNKLRFDFYLPTHNTLIEYDGVQHFKPIEYFGGVEYLKEVKINDNIKNIFCENNKIKLHRISYNQKLNKKLNQIKSEIMENT